MYSHQVSPGLNQLKWVAMIAIFFSIITLGMDSAVYAFFTNVKLGSWWAALGIILLGLASLRSKSNGMITSILVLSIFVIIMSLVGTVLDASGSIYFSKNLYACTTPTNILSGNQNYYRNATTCYQKALNQSKPSSKCYCVDTDGCAYINGPTDCGKIFTYYTKLLSSATYFDFLSFLSLIALSIVTVCIVCCPSNCGGNSSSIYVMDDPLYEGAEAIPIHNQQTQFATAQYVNNNNNNNNKEQPYIVEVISHDTPTVVSENSIPVVRASLVQNR